MGNHASVSKRVSGGMTLMLVLILSMALMVPTQLAWADETQGGGDMNALGNGAGVEIYDASIEYDYDLNGNNQTTRVTVAFKLTEDVDLTFINQDRSSLIYPTADIVIDYYVYSEEEGFIIVNQKNKFWDNFLVSNAGIASEERHPFSVQTENVLNILPKNTEFRTTSSNWRSGAQAEDIDKIIFSDNNIITVNSDTVFAATIRVTDADGKSHAVTVFSKDMFNSGYTVNHRDIELGVGVDATVAALPLGVTMQAMLLEGDGYNDASQVFKDYTGFSAFDISFRYTENNNYQQILAYYGESEGVREALRQLYAQPQAPVTLLLPMDGVNEGNSGQFEYTGLDIATGDTSAATFAAPNHGTFSASHFSGYALGWKPVGSNNPVIPATSDLLAPLGIVVLGLLICAGSVALFAGKRKHARSEQ